MSLFDAFRYDGRRVLVVGGASGMGAATAQLLQDAGAEVVVLDFAVVTLPGAKAIRVNLADHTSHVIWFGPSEELNLAMFT